MLRGWDSIVELKVEESWEMCTGHSIRVLPRCSLLLNMKENLVIVYFSGSWTLGRNNELLIGKPHEDFKKSFANEKIVKHVMFDALKLELYCLILTCT